MFSKEKNSTSAITGLTDMVTGKPFDFFYPQRGTLLFPWEWESGWFVPPWPEFSVLTLKIRNNLIDRIHTCFTLIFFLFVSCVSKKFKLFWVKFYVLSLLQISCLPPLFICLGTLHIISWSELFVLILQCICWNIFCIALFWFLIPPPQLFWSSLVCKDTHNMSYLFIEYWPALRLY